MTGVVPNSTYLREVRAHEDHARLESIIELSSDAIYDGTLDGTLTNWNPAAERLYGYAAAEVVGRHAALLLVPRDLTQETLGLVERIRQGERLTHYETERLHKDGRRLFISLSLAPVQDVGGAIVGVTAIARDITEHRQRDAALQRYKLLAAHTNDLVLFIGPDLRILDCNDAAVTAYGYARTDLLQLSIPDLRAPETESPTSAQMVQAASGGLVFETIHQRQDGTTLAVEVSSVTAGIGDQPMVLSIIRDISRRRAGEANLRHQALYDHAIAVGDEDRSPVALLLFDLDRFKEVNDTLGHRVGDVLLQQVGQRLQSAVRASDLVARLGGDEFAVLLPRTDAPTAAGIAADLAGVLEAPFIVEARPIRVDASIGIAVAPEQGQDADTLLRCADVAMYQAKRSGTGIGLYSVADDQYRPEHLALLGELRTAIDHGQLVLHYQPKLDLRNGELVGVEALVRWQHPKRGFLPPGEFIPLAEDTGLIYPLSRWVIETALEQQHVWRHEGIQVPVSVNVSRRSLHDPLFPGMVAESLTRWSVSPDALVLEITESSLMADPQRASETLKQVRALGVRISIDDFGTGYSSLASLKNLPVDELKIDQSFVRAMATDTSSRAIVQAIIDLADALNLRTVAEGVENRAAWDALESLFCEIVQGYFVSRPISAADLEVWIREQSSSWLAVPGNSRLKLVAPVNYNQRTRLAMRDSRGRNDMADGIVSVLERIN
jgi:diguanylate cyclase (GGDEF)-like protein/PAS domain S-box-containing protein